MKFQFDESTASGWAELTATPIDFDAFPPVGRLRVQWPLGEQSIDRIALAASLVFSPWIAGRCDLPKPFSALTNQRITEWFQNQGIWVTPTPVRAGGLPLPRGQHTFEIVDGERRTEHSGLILAPALAGSGPSTAGMRIASNLDSLAAFVDSPAHRHLIRLGAAVLVAESLAINVLHYPAFADECPDDFAAASRLLECAALGLHHD